MGGNWLRWWEMPPRIERNAVYLLSLYGSGEPLTCREVPKSRSAFRGGRQELAVRAQREVTGRRADRLRALQEELGDAFLPLEIDMRDIAALDSLARLESPWGEIDLLLEDRDELVAVEVKTRDVEDLEQPEEAVSWRQLRRIRPAGGVDQSPCQSNGHGVSQFARFTGR